MNKLKKSKYVKDWFITKNPNNVYNLVINTTQRYCYHHHFGVDENLLLFQISETECQDITTEDIILEIPEFLPKIEGLWLESSITVKDQIHYYFIPYLKEWIKLPDKLILKSKDYE